MWFVRYDRRMPRGLSGDPADLLKGSTTDQIVKVGLAAQSVTEGVTAVKEFVTLPEHKEKK